MLKDDDMQYGRLPGNIPGRDFMNVAARLTKAQLKT